MKHLGTLALYRSAQPGDNLGSWKKPLLNNCPPNPSAESTEGDSAHILGIFGIHGQELGLIPQAYEALNGTPITIRSYNIPSLVMRPFKVYFLSNFQTYNTGLLTRVTMLYITPHDLFIQN